MPQAGFEPTIPAGEWLQTHALDRSAAGIGPVTFRFVAQCFNQLRHRVRLEVYGETNFQVELETQITETKQCVSQGTLNFIKI